MRDPGGTSYPDGKGRLQGKGPVGSVEVAELGRASLLTLMLKQILERSLQDPRK